MKRTGFVSHKLTTDDKLILTDITSLTLSNYGDKDLVVIVNDVERTVPALKSDIGVPFGSFNIPGDGTACALVIEVRFQDGQGLAILDYRKVQPKTC